MIPKNISLSDVLKAIGEVEKDGIPPDRHSTQWSALYNDNKFPPKCLISLANRYANGEEWYLSKFSGGDETYDHLKA